MIKTGGFSDQQSTPMPSSELASASRSDGTSPPARLEAMVAQHFNVLWRFLKRLGLSDADVDDAAQEVILVAAKKLDQIEFDRERSFLLGTAFRIARRVKSAGHIGDDELLRRLDETADQRPNPEQSLGHEQECALLDGILQTLPLDLRAVFVLFEIEERTMAEIASALDLPPGTVASRLRRARSAWQHAVSRVQSQMQFAARSRSARGTGAEKDCP